MLFSLSVGDMRAQQLTRKDTVRVFFYQGWSDISPALKENRRALDSIAHIVGEYSRDPRFHMTVNGWASPEGASYFNVELSEARAAAIVLYIQERSGVRLTQRSTTLAGHGIDWAGLENSLMRGEDFDGRDDVLRIIRDVPIWLTEGNRVVGGRKKALMDLEGGEVFGHLMLGHFPSLRRAEIILEYVPYPPVKAVPALVSEVAALDETILPPQPLPERIPFHRFALKTNLLSDLILTPSLGFEWLINRSWSVSANANVAWWSNAPKHRYYQIAAIYPEARWWFSTRSPWHGHYLGLFAGGTWYDLENGGRGYQGEGGFAGLSYGYMFPVGRSLSFEVEVGAGYLFSEYEEYLPVPYEGSTHYVYQQTSQLHYFGPLKLSFALVWRFGDIGLRNNKKGGAK